MEKLIRLAETKLPLIGSFCLRVILTIIIYLVVSKMIRWFCKILKQSMLRANAPLEVISFGISLVKGGLYALLVFTLATQFGIDASSVAALLASAGVGVGLALQGGLSNFAGGVILLLLKPFVVGDYIIEDGGKNEGTVQKIEMYYTTLVTVDNRKIVIPNATLTSNTVTNVTAMDERKLEIKVDVSYESDIRKAKEILMQLIQEESEIRKDKEIQVFVDELAESSVRLGMRVWVNTDRYWPIKWRMNEKIKLAFDQEEIVIPYPQMDIHIQQDRLGKER